MTPFFSVIVPVYNVEPYLRECIDSILAQTFSDFELILVDDDSPDGCPAICDEYAAADERVSVIHKTNAGVTAARKAGLLRAKAEYVSFIDSDDTVVPHYLQTLHAIIRENDAPDVILHGLTRVYSDRSEDMPPLPAPGLYDKAALEKEIYPYMMVDRRAAETGDQLLPGYMWDKPGRRQLYLDHYLQDERIGRLEDVSMVYEVLYHAKAVYICGDCLYRYRMRGGSLMSNYTPDFFRTLQYIYDYLDAHLIADYPPARDQARTLIALFALNNIWDEFRHGHRFSEALRHVRTELNETGLMRNMDPRLFSGPKRLYLTLLKHGICWPVVLAARLQAAVMKSSVQLRYETPQDPS